MKKLLETSKTAYSRAKKSETRKQIFNFIMLNGSEDEKREFVRWQTERSK